MSRVQTVRGPIDSSELGITLTHEHIVNDVSSWWQRSESTGIDPDAFAAAPVSMDLLWELRQDPFGNLDNCRLDDHDLAAVEVARFADRGGQTIIETTGLGIGRDLRALRRISEQTGVHIVAGTGYYLEGAQPDWLAEADAEQIAARITRDLTEGEDGIRPGIIGEIGVGADFSAAERKSLTAGCLVQVATGLPIQVHLPGWFRRGHDVLDLASDCGVDLRRVILCHMNPSGADPDYQRSLLARGARLQFDMIGAELFYADQGVQCPSDEQTAEHLTALIADGLTDQLLMSSDIFLKNLLRSYGGPGYGHVLQYFVPRLRRHGITDSVIENLLITNPRTLFEPEDH